MADRDPASFSNSLSLKELPNQSPAGKRSNTRAVVAAVTDWPGITWVFDFDGDG
ncbi:hypothetical protein K8I61_19095 [bacterium]|nr:hypothetical protein [bacterium]